MAIRNNKLGGTDFADGEILYDYDLDDTNNAMINFAAKGQAQIPFSILKGAGAFTNEGNLAADKTTDSNGIKNTINAGSSTAIFDTDKYIIAPYYLEITATSLTGNWNINGCELVQINSNTWRLFSGSTDVEISRANLYNTLFDSINGRLIGTTYATGVTAIKTPFTNDVGKCGFAYTYTGVTSFSLSGGYCITDTVLTGTFTNTTDNTNVSAWSYVYSKRGVGSNAMADYTRFEMPSSTVLNTITAPTSSTAPAVSDERFIDTSADNKNNPSTFTLRTNPCKENSGGNSYTSIARVVILSKGSINVTAITKSADTTITDDFSINYNVDYSIPFMTAFSSYEIYSSVIVDTGTLTLRGDESSVSVFNPSSIPVDTSIKCTLNDGTKDISAKTTLSENNGTVIPLTATPVEGSTLELHYSLETTDISKTPEWYGYGVYKY